MKITTYKRTNGIKVYTLEHNNLPIASSTDINKIISLKEGILFPPFNKTK